MTATATAGPTPTKPRRPLTGRIEARLFTPPLRTLSRRTSLGFEVCDFAASIDIVLLPWQRWLLKHALELLPDGSFRFRTILLLVARQNGKTLVSEVITAWMMATRPNTLVLGTSTATELAREPWGRVVQWAEDAGIARRVTRGSIDTQLHLDNKSRYKIATSGRRGGRSLSVDLLLVDELREHLDWSGWNALTATTTARPNPLTLALSNAGDDRSIVLNAIRASALSGQDPALGIFEWSGEDGCELDDPKALAQANPSLGHLITDATLATKRTTLPANGYRTEHLCQRVEAEDPAINPDAWRDGADPGGTLDGLRHRVVCSVEVSLDLTHVSLVAGAVLDDGRMRVESVASWPSPDDARKALPELLARINPRAVGWLPNGPAAAMAADLRKVARSQEISAGDVTALCMGAAEIIQARRVLHSDDPMLTAQVLAASKIPAGDGWRFTRKGSGNCDAVYAMAITIHLARTMHAQKGKLRVLLPS
jgi:hypothetical protein